MNDLALFGINDPEAVIDWEINPALTYGLFECRGDMQKVRHSRERYYYFFIDNWQKPARLCLMERGIRHARVVAEVAAPHHLIDQCLRNQGHNGREQNFAVDGKLKNWLTEELLQNNGQSSLITRFSEDPQQIRATGLPGPTRELDSSQQVALRREGRVVPDEEIPALIKSHDFFEAKQNDCGQFANMLIDNLDEKTVTDRRTGLIWQREGSDHCSFVRLKKWITKINRQGYAGRNNWRLPSLDEVLSLLESNKNSDGVHLHPCFSPVQGYVYTSDRHKPGGYWFVDFRQATVFWAGGTLSGGFARLCQTSSSTPSARDQDRSA